MIVQSRRIPVPLAALVCVAACGAEPQASLDPKLEISQSGVQLTLVAEHPDIVTPTGIDVDAAGKIWAVSSHTHFRPEHYPGPEHDEVLVLDSDGGRRVFYNETDATMDLELAPDFHDGDWVYLAERDRILRVRDSNADGRGDEQQDLAVLDTEADYPHNGLSGLAWHPSGDLIFSLGENYWSDWTLRATDGSAVRGTGEGGIFRCRPDGTSLRRIARGFWNPFGVCVRDDGTMFAAENDPGARPPCRLLHVVEGGDYGYQRLYGNAPFHPFVCWDGQLRGTLPMLHGLGEAPCGIAPLGAGLVVPSWTDHRIDFYPLKTDGASFSTHRVTLVAGGHHFRPTCIAADSPTVFYLTDWVFGSYELHGRGRIWRLEVKPDDADWLGDRHLAPISEAAELAAALRSGGKSFTTRQLFNWATDEDPFLRLAAIDALAARAETFDRSTAGKLSKEDQISLLLALRKSDSGGDWVRYFLGQADGDIQFETLRWIADAQLKEFLPEVERLLGQSEIDYSVFEASLAAWNTLSGNPRAGVADPQMLMARVNDQDASPQTRAFALRLLDPKHTGFSPDLWQLLYQSGDPLLIRELTRALASNRSPQAKKLMLRIAEDETLEVSTRGDALAGLAGSSGVIVDRLVDFAESSASVLREEALRSLRFAALSDQQQSRLGVVAKTYPGSADLAAAAIDPLSVKESRPDVKDTAAWQSLLSDIGEPVDLSAGRRIFHHTTVATCGKCHRHTGRGSVVGPDLTAASNADDPDRLLRALLQPSRDVDPQYFPRALVTHDGEVFTGIMLRDGGGGNEVYRDNTGRERRFRTEDIAERKELSTSMMPDGLIDLMTNREIRDLLAFLDESKAEAAEE